MATKNGKIDTKRVTRSLVVVLKPEDQTELRERARLIDQERESLEEELAEQTRALRARIRERHEAREKVVQAMITGKEKRPVDCEERWDYVRHQVTVVRKDTGEVVESPRPMTNEEMQLRLPSTEASAT